MSTADDALAVPVSFDARDGAGRRRALVLGGGGVVFVAWLTAYLSELGRRAIGAAALAAATPSSDLLPAALFLLLQSWRWPTGDLVVSAVDAYSGERLAVTKRADVPLLRAVAASASVPGLSAPQRLGDRRAMDGGVSGSGIHADLVAGASLALVFPIADRLAAPMCTIQPDATDREVRALRASGTEVEVRWTRLASTTNLMDPAEVPTAVALGAAQGAEDADGLRDFWVA